MSNKRLSIHNIKKQYDGKVVLDIADLYINYGEVTAIVGTSGAGKSTLLNILGTLEKPTSGEVYIESDGEKYNIFDNAVDYRSKKAGFIFQDMNLIDGLSAGQNVKVGKLLANISDGKDETSALKELSLDNATQKSETLSGGEKQRVAIARAISKNAEIILADEPSGNLDSKNANLVFANLRSMKENRCIIVITHDMTLAEKYADRIICISDGKIVSDTLNVSTEKQIENENDYTKNQTIQATVKSKKKNRLKVFFDFIFLTGINSVRKRFFRMLSIVFVMALSVSMIVALINYNQEGNAVVEKTNKSYLETDLITVRDNDDYIMPFKGTAKETVEDIFADYDVDGITEDYSWFRYNVMISNDRYTTRNSVSVKSVNINDFFKKRVLANDITGGFPEKDDEIIVGINVAETLFSSDCESCLGQTVKLNDGNGNSVSVKIVGINRTQNVNKEYYNFIPCNALKELERLRLISNFDNNYIQIEEMRYERKLGVNQWKTLTFTTSSIEVITAEPNDLKYKKDNVSRNQNYISIFISSNIFENEYVVKQNNKSETEIFNELSSVEYAVCADDIFSAYICGVYESENERDYSVRIYQEDKEKICTPLPSQINVYIHDVYKSEETVDALSAKYNNLLIISEYKNLRLGVVNNFRFYSLALGFISVLFFIISLVMLSSLTKLLSHERSREVAIVKSLGAKNSWVLGMLLFDMFAISAMVIALSIVFSAIIYFVMPLIFTDFSVLAIKFPIGLIFMVGAIFTVVTILFTSLFLFKTAKKTPLALLRS